MRVDRRHLGVLAAAAVLAWACVGFAQDQTQAPQQQPSAPCSASPELAPCSVPNSSGSAKPDATKPAAQRFPFPGEPAAGDASTPAAPAADSGNAAKKFPFPGEPGASGDAGANAPSPSDATKKFPFPGEPAAGSSSSSGDSTPDPNLQPDAPAGGASDAKDADGQPKPSGRRLLNRVNPVGTPLLSDEEREAEDLQITKYYMQSGNLDGALLRAKDAVKLAPDDPDAHYALAQVALKTNKPDLAATEFNALLKLDADPKQLKEARKQLEKLK